MPRVRTKNEIASHLVALVRNEDAPRAPNTVAEAPPPKPEPAAAPVPRWTRMKPIMKIASRTYSTINRVNNIDLSSLSVARGGGDGSKIGGRQGGTADQCTVD